MLIIVKYDDDNVKEKEKRAYGRAPTESNIKCSVLLGTVDCPAKLAIGGRCRRCPNKVRLRKAVVWYVGAVRGISQPVPEPQPHSGLMTRNEKTNDYTIVYI